MDDRVVQGVVYRYWVRFVGRNGEAGPWHSDAGDTIELRRSASDMMEEISNEITNSPLYFMLTEGYDGTVEK